MKSKLPKLLVRLSLLMLIAFIVLFLILVAQFIGLIGSVKRISDPFEIIGARNYIAHEYGSLIYDLIVKVINHHLPILKEEVKILLEQKD